MEGLIVISARLTASTADILQGTRLQTVPANGVLTFELQSDLSDGTNNYVTSIQLPDGSTPFNGVLVPASAAGTAGVIDDREKLMASFGIGQGGHPVFSVTETGAAVLTYRVTYQPGR